MVVELRLVAVESSVVHVLLLRPRRTLLWRSVVEFSQELLKVQIVLTLAVDRVIVDQVLGPALRQISREFRTTFHLLDRGLKRCQLSFGR